MTGKDKAREDLVKIDAWPDEWKRPLGYNIFSRGDRLALNEMYRIKRKAHKCWDQKNYLIVSQCWIDIQKVENTLDSGTKGWVL